MVLVLRGFLQTTKKRQDLMKIVICNVSVDKIYYCFPNFLWEYEMKKLVKGD